MECKVSELVRLGHDKAAQFKSSGGAVSQLISDLATQLDVQLSRGNALAAENAGLKAICDDRRMFIMNGVQLGYIQVPTVETDPALETIRVAVSPQEPTQATEVVLTEVRAHDLNAFIRHHSAELDAHIKNGGEQFDEKSVRIRDIIVSARLFREQIRKGVRS
ncbi:hypothetical protein P2M49_27810 [Klebsiella quasivariicola]|uniref:hypothetical protein n=1 Tax=Klebsiella quasivariicola TaxID=2026240 RepID=UPI0023DCAB0F|nr:hypothetical protein [Klebsiella quasivariicola]MDF2009956.1 hypothetical protein [Klebsiella quasivariicola]